ncbi:hypothetical protein ACP5WJ_12660, partial [Bacteroides thetaiotaomicron]
GNKAISFYNEGEYEEALDAIRNSSMATSKDGQNLIRECEKLILEQYVYLIKEYIEQQDYLNASRKKEEYKTKYGSNPKIENIIIPYVSVMVDQKECSEHQISNNQSQQSVKRKLPLYRKLFCMKRTGLIIIAIIALSLISLLGYRSYKSTAIEEEYQRQMAIDTYSGATPEYAIEKEQEEFGLEVSNDVPNPTVGSTIIGFEYYGMINEKYPIVMRLGWREPNEIGGSYYYVKNGRNNTLELSGSMNSNDYMILKEYNSAGEHTGTFEGKWSMDSYSGTFTNYKGVKMPFKLYRETTATNNSDITFNSYQNSRFNYTITYPSFLNKRQESENGDGCKFYMDDNTYLIVSGMYNALDESIISRYNEYKSKSVTYSIQKDNWFVISDYTSNGNIFYTKTVLQNGVFFTATFYYPAKDKDKYNSVIKKIFTNFPLKSNTSSVSNSLSSFFSKNVGKYPSDINLLEFPLLKTRLIALVGNNNYNFIKTYFQVVTPIKLGFNKNPNLYEVSGGEEHNCMSNNTTIVYNQQLDNLTVQLIKEGSDPFIFQEKKDDSPFE